MPAYRARIVGLRERRHDAVHASRELGHDTNPAQQSSAEEVAFSPGSNVWFAIIRDGDRRHRLCKVVPYLDMLLKHVIPGCLVELDEMASGLRASARMSLPSTPQG